ncbi:class I SAM-dependent methyltransferase [Phormidium sp. CLA17]|uniref:class I SAM-dependent methyltransferase n=1 Tax=Leptolyngbya sp. Cla-17 TaxID=2803751 RepID=UPI001491F8C9|nr:class I SAM-dependent methyltransferase [Leptolyngbya sp. Cla-17]MBM0743823.1 class I SAM-dependent methyltransferase [Leptolyngbya sp. Cla-17]
MRTDYPGHDRIYQRNRNDPDYAGWFKYDEMIEYWQLSWRPLTQKNAFPKQGKLLELGCGAGNPSIFLAQAGYNVTGIDIAPTAIAWAIENAFKANILVTFMQGDVLRLTEVADASFNIALDSRCFHCIIGSDRAQFLRTAHRVLKHSGILVINTMCNEVPATPYWNNYFDVQTRCTIHDGLATRYVGDSNDILQEIIQSSFRVLDVEVLPRRNEEDIAELQVIAEKR